MGDERQQLRSELEAQGWTWTGDNPDARYSSRVWWVLDQHGKEWGRSGYSPDDAWESALSRVQRQRKAREG